MFRFEVEIIVKEEKDAKWIREILNKQIKPRLEKDESIQYDENECEIYS